MLNQAPHCGTIEELARDLGSRPDYGISQAEARARLARLGPNCLQARPAPGWFAQLGAQLGNYLVVILLLAGALSLALGEITDALAILSIVILNAVVGVIQERKADEALRALTKLTAPTATVLRGGDTLTIPAQELVPGDLVLLEEGNQVPADLRLVQSIGLRVDEASLTGESQTAGKDAGQTLSPDTPLGERLNCTFMGTLVATGRGRGLVTHTGMATQIGLIAAMIEACPEEATPLQKQLAQLGKVLGLGCLLICGLVLLIGLLRDTAFSLALQGRVAEYLSRESGTVVTLIMTAVSLAIAAIPEGLPAIVTLCLALGMRQMLRRNALIRKLPAVETLGCTTVICSDKTGTLTQNRMQVVEAWVGRSIFHLGGAEADAASGFVHDEDLFKPPLRDEMLLMLAALACNDAHMRRNNDNRHTFFGDPTDVALVEAALHTGLRPDHIDTALPRTGELPFDSGRKRMNTVHQLQDRLRASLNNTHIGFAKGAPEAILSRCTHFLADGRTEVLDVAAHARITAQNTAMAGKALRVLALAYVPLDAGSARSPAAADENLTFLGLIGMIDPPRPEVAAALRTARDAGLRVFMITGDHRETAAAIGRDIGLFDRNARLLDGQELDRLDDDALARQIDSLAGCCRVSPQHKTRIVDAFKRQGHVVAMTGDGVNDAPALKRADIGIAMGLGGTDVARETADMVLTDDNFASIVAAIEQGRIIYANIRKFVYFLLACNLGEILIVLGAMLAGLPLPFRPVQLLWLNLVTDGLPALALGLEPGEPNVMKQAPRTHDEPVLDQRMFWGVAWVGVIDALAILGVFTLALHQQGWSLATAQTMAFVTLAGSELLRAFTTRSESRSLFSLGWGSNPWMLRACGISMLLVLAVVYLPFLQPFFATEPLGITHWRIMLPFMLAAPLAMEAFKLFWRQLQKNRG